MYSLQVYLGPIWKEAAADTQSAKTYVRIGCLRMHYGKYKKFNISCIYDFNFSKIPCQMRLLIDPLFCKPIDFINCNINAISLHIYDDRCALKDLCLDIRNSRNLISKTLVNSI